MIGSEAARKRIDVSAFGREVVELMKNWRGHLAKNPARAQQVMRKILPRRIEVTPPPKGSKRWAFNLETDYSKIVEEIWAWT